MKRKLSIATFLMLVTNVIICTAAPITAGGYASGFIGLTVPQESNPTTFNFAGNSVFNDRVEFDPGLNIGGNAGYDFGFFRLEGEISYKNSEIDSITDKADGFKFLNVDGDLGALAMMFNAFVDLHNRSAVTPYVGGGIGFASLRLGETIGVDTRGGTVEQLLLYVGDTDTVFAYQAGAGLEIALNEVYSLDFGYRFFGTDTARFGTGSENATNLKFKSHNAVLGFRAKF